MIATDLSKYQAVDADPRVTQDTNFTGNLERVGRTQMLFIIEEVKEAILDFCKEL